MHLPYWGRPQSERQGGEVIISVVLVACNSFRRKGFRLTLTLTEFSCLLFCLRIAFFLSFLWRGITQHDACATAEAPFCFVDAASTRQRHI